MRGLAGPWLVTEVIDTIYAQPSYAGLHSGPVDPDDPIANEIQGAGYSRRQISWIKLGGVSVANATTIVWSGMTVATVRSIGVYTSATGTGLMMRIPLMMPLSIKSGGTFRIASQEIYLDLV
jgi:hypothetical protein